jgi:uncharacterized membrane protein
MAAKFSARLQALRQDPGLVGALGLAGLFFGATLLFALNRYYSFYSSYDHGLFNQVFWNNLHGHWFQSSLTGSNSVATLHDGVIPPTNFLHLGQHFVLDFLIWWPLYALAPHPVTLIGLQVGLMTAGGLLLYALARCRLSPALSVWIVGSYYSANAVLGPTFANFYEHCQIPIFAFGLFLALEKRCWGWFGLCAVGLLGVREEVGGMLLFGVGLYLAASRRLPIWFGLGLATVGFSYVAIVTNVIMPQYSDDNSRLYLATRFRQFVDTPNPSTLQVLWGMVTHPVELLKSLLLPADRRFFYLFRHWLPLGFVSIVSPATWALAGVPLLSLFLQNGVSALSISLRYAIAVVPGLFYGTILWWDVNPHRFTPKFRRWWRACILLSLVLAVSSNPNRVFSWLIPDSVRPWVYVSLPSQWQHAQAIHQVIGQIPPNASVTATTYLIPHLSGRREIVRLPTTQLRPTPQDPAHDLDYAVADLWQMQQYQVAFKEDRIMLAATLPMLRQLAEPAGAAAPYGVITVQDGVVLMARGQASAPGQLAAWRVLRDQLQQQLIPPK